MPSEEKQSESSHVDGLLEMWVELAERTGTEIAVTLMVGGSLVSGRIISGPNYLRRFADDLRTAFESGGHPEAGERIQQSVGDMAGELETEAREEKEEDAPPRRHIHLDDANVFLARDALPIHVPYWRGKLEAVDAWVFGKAEVTA
jgi:hypothetical protein